MNLAGKALWFIESHFAEEITLDDIAAAANVSRYHMSRAFGLAAGRSVMRYVRGRRLTEAARALAEGAPDILTVALEAGYNSHEAFTRAFRDQFGVTPETVRLRGNLDNLECVEAITMSDISNTELEEPRLENGGAMLIAGLRGRYGYEAVAGIPLQWQRFQPWIGNIPGRISGHAYGVCSEFDDAGNFDYLCGVEVSSVTDLPAELSFVRVPAQRYLVFPHRGHIASISAAWRAIMGRFLPESEYRLAETPSFERYGPGFDLNSGLGEVEIWVPVHS